MELLEITEKGSSPVTRPQRASTRLQTLFLFFRLERLPIAQDIRRGFRFHIAENVRVTVHQFFGKTLQYLVNGKRIFLPSHLGIEQNLQQQVAQFAAQLVPIATVNGFEDFISLF